MRIFHKLLLLLAGLFLASLLNSATPAAFCQTEPDPANLDFTGVQVEKDVPYLSTGRTEKLNLYRPAEMIKGKKYPAMVIIHGGGWYSGAKDNTREKNFATNLVRAGYICVSVDYTLASQGSSVWPLTLEECKTAVQFLRANAQRYQVDPQRIGALGGSAGGHLALMLGFTGATGNYEPKGPYQGVSSKVQAVVGFYGPTNLLTIGLQGMCERLLGGTRETNRARWEEASPVNHVTAKAPPVLIVHGTEDKGVPFSQSEELIAKLKEKSVPYQLQLVQGAGHSFDFQPPQQDLRPVVIEFLDKYLKRKR